MRAQIRWIQVVMICCCVCRPLPVFAPTSPTKAPAVVPVTVPMPVVGTPRYDQIGYSDEMKSGIVRVVDNFDPRLELNALMFARNIAAVYISLNE